MADQEISSSSRSVRAPPCSSNSDLLHTIAQLREQRSTSTSSSTQNKAAPSATHRHGSQQPSSSGRRRLCKVHSNGAPKGSTNNFNEDLEDWHEEGDLETSGSADNLVNSLDKLSITTDYCKVTSDVKADTQKSKLKIMDSLAFLNEARKLSESAKTNRHVIAADDVDSLDVNISKRSDVTNVHEIKRSDRDDKSEIFSHSKPNLISRSHGGFANKSGEVCWDLEDEKENSGAEAVTFVHNKIVFKLPQKIANILYPHQHEGIKWLWGLHIKGMGGILGDDMGLGKTMQIASFFVGLFASDLIKHALIVAPKTLIAHWLKELSFVGLGKKTKE